MERLKIQTSDITRIMIDGWWLNVIPGTAAIVDTTLTDGAAMLGTILGPTLTAALEVQTSGPDGYDKIAAPVGHIQAVGYDQGRGERS